MSLKAPLCKAMSCSTIGKVESQLEAPFSEDTSIAFWRQLGSSAFRLATVIACRCWRKEHVLF